MPGYQTLSPVASSRKIPGNFQNDYISVFQRLAAFRQFHSFSSKLSWRKLSEIFWIKNDRYQFPQNISY